MKKFILSVSFILVFSAYAVYARVFGASPADFIAPESAQNTPASTPIANKPSTEKTITSNNNVKYKDGTFTGDIVDASYGNVQVRVQTSHDKIVKVEFLDYPHDMQNSVRINTRATPKLISEAIAAQDANVNTVSGASFTSAAFRESLSSALAKAKV